MGVRRNDRADPDLEDLLLSGNVGVREERIPSSRERFHVGVVAVVHSTHLADALKQMRRGRPVLAEPGPRQPKRREIWVAAVNFERMAKRNRRRPGVLLDDLHLDSLRILRRDGGWAPGLSFRERGKD